MSQTTLEAPIVLTPISANPQSASLDEFQDIPPDGPPVPSPSQRATSQGHTTLLLLTLSLLTALRNFSTGLLTIELPTIAADISLNPPLALWPQAVHALTSSVRLLPAGSIADALGVHARLSRELVGRIRSNGASVCGWGVGGCGRWG